MLTFKLTGGTIMFTLKALLIALGITLLGSLGLIVGGQAWGWGPGGNGGGPIMVGAPGPIAGVGLPVLAVVGGLMWVRSRRRRRKDQPEI